MSILGSTEQQSNTTPYVNAYRSLDRIAEAATVTDVTVSARARRATAAYHVSMLVLAVWMLALAGGALWLIPSFGAALVAMGTLGLAAGHIGANALWGIRESLPASYKGRFRRSRKRA